MESHQSDLHVLDKRTLILSVILVFLAAVLMQKGYTKPYSQPAEISISAPVWTNDDFSGLIEFKVTNTSNRPIRFAKWDTPITGEDGEYFDVFYNGDPVAYEGRSIRRRSPTAADLVILRPGESRTVLVDLSNSYDISRAGHYFVRYRKIISVPSMGQEYKAMSREAPLVELRSQAAEFVRSASGVSQDKSRVAVESAVAQEMRPSIWYRYCSVQQQEVIASAHSLARNFAADARSSLAVGIAGARYRTWFGAVSSQNMSVVRTHFDNMDFVTRSGSTEFICDCTTANAYAYVNKSFPGQVHLCPLFWSTSNTQRANSIIHELSHLSKSVGAAGANGTEDYVYGQTQAEQLAHANPGYAVDNAENYGFYAQNPYGQSN